MRRQVIKRKKPVHVDTGAAGWGFGGPLLKYVRAAVAILLGATAGAMASQPGYAEGGYQRGPEPTVASVAATNGPFATAR